MGLLNNDYGTKKNLFDHMLDIRDEPAQPGPILFDGIFLSQFKIQKFEVLTRFGHLVQNYRIKF